MKEANVKLEARQARVVYDDARQTPERLASTISTLGFKASLVSVEDVPKSEATPKR